MAWRFTPSKYKNTAPMTPKKEGTVYDLPVGATSCANNNGICANARLMAFIIDGEGGKLGVLPLGARGRRLRTDLNILCAHSEPVADFCFMPFSDQDLLATCAGAGKTPLKLWKCDAFADERVGVLTTSECCAQIGVGETDGARTILDCLAPHKTAGNLLGVGLSINAPVIVNVDAQRVAIALESDKIDRSFSLDWAEDGKLLAVSTDKGKRAYVFDPRASKTAIHELSLHEGVGRENRILFADGNLISSGFTSNRAQEVLLFDPRGSWSTPAHAEAFEGSTGVLMPFYDADSKMLFLAGKGASKFFLTEIRTIGGRPSIGRLCEHPLKDQTLGACLLPKTACDVMAGEVQRFHQLTKNGIVPIPCIVPRRSYQQFHNDLFPDTTGAKAGCESQAWISGSNDLPPKVKLDPNGAMSTDDGNNSEAGNRRPSLSTAADSATKPIETKTSVHYRDVIVRREEGEKIDEKKLDITTKNDDDEKMDQQSTGVCGLGSKTANNNDKNNVDKDGNNGIFSEWSDDEDKRISTADVNSSDNFTDGTRRNDALTTTNSNVANGLNLTTAAATKTPTTEDFRDKENTKKKQNAVGNTASKKAGGSPPIVRLRNASRLSDARAGSMIVGASSADNGNRRSRPKSCVVGTIQSKFRHVEVIAGANKSVFINLRNVNNRLPTESDGFCISQKYAALPLAGTAGIISILELCVPMKIPDGIIDGLQNRAQVMDLQWNPFRVDELAVALDNGVVNVWRVAADVPCIGSEAFVELQRLEKAEKEAAADPVVASTPARKKPRQLSDLEPHRTLNTGQQVRVTHVRYHPLVKDLLAIGLLNGFIQVWNVEDGVCLLEIPGHSQGILSLAWSADGHRLASVGRDAFLRIYEPLLGAQCCIAEARVLDGTRAARVLFVCEDSLILVVGFSKSSARQCALFRLNTTVDELNENQATTPGSLELLHTETIDVSTQPLVPYYDYDTSVVFLTGKGDRTIQMFEVCLQPPHFLRLTPTTFPVAHQSIALYQKNACDVRDVEFACGWRLTEKIVEKLSFKVPRVKKELFQRDVFPHALVSWEPTGSATEWRDGVLNRPRFVDLRPDGMQECETARK